MKLNQFFVAPALLGALLLSACGEKEATPELMPAAPLAAPVAAPAPIVNEAGGYEPSPEERVPGITRTQEELDKMAADVRASTPQPVIPGEAPAAVEPAPAADAEAAPAVSK